MDNITFTTIDSEYGALHVATCGLTGWQGCGRDQEEAIVDLKCDQCHHSCES